MNTVGRPCSWVAGTSPAMTWWEAGTAERHLRYAASACHMAMIMPKPRASPTVPEPILFIT
jgi:hypothetical protein